MRGCAYPVTGGRSATCARTSRPTARRCRSGSTRSRDALGDAELTAYELVPEVFGESSTRMMMSWALTIMLCFLTHLEQTGRVERVRSPDEQEPERWRGASLPRPRTP